MILAIGVKNDHIFQGIIYGQPRHPLMLRAINHAFSKSILSKVANLEYMIFCKELWRLLGTDLGHAPQVGWNQGKRFGPIYLLRERHSLDLQKTKELNNDGHYFETKSGMSVAYTRCWNWQKGLLGDPRAHQRMENTLMQSVPQAVSEAFEAGSAASSAPRPVPGALPTNSGSRVGDTVLHSLDDGDFDRIMQAIDNEPQYQGLTAESVLRNIPRGLCTHPDGMALLPDSSSPTSWASRTTSCRAVTTPSKRNQLSLPPLAKACGRSRAPTQDTPPRWVPTAAVANARFGLGLPPIPARLNSPTEGRRPFYYDTNRVGPRRRTLPTPRLLLP